MLKFTTIAPSAHLKPLIERYLVVEGNIPPGQGIESHDDSHHDGVRVF
ncbi:MAG TPA: hypothetical protein VIT44_03265 [Cyclobacteriaceae bacterium]